MGIRGTKDWADTAHLPIIRGRVDIDISGLSKSGEAGEAEDSQSGQAEFPR